jgi:hypothetical protein
MYVANNNKKRRINKKVSLVNCGYQGNPVRFHCGLSIKSYSEKKANLELKSI